MLSSYLDRLREIDLFGSCLCPRGHCRERGKIVWDGSYGNYIHLRFNHCIMNNEPFKRCDCIVFFQFADDETNVFIFVVEVKDRWYKLTEIQEKMKTCIEKLCNEIGIIRPRTVVIPVLYAERHISNARRTFSNYPVKIMGKSHAIKYLKHGERITNAIAPAFHP